MIYIICVKFTTLKKYIYLLRYVILFAFFFNSSRTSHKKWTTKVFPILQKFL